MSDLTQPDLTTPLAIHLVGAGGAGMNAIGVVLAEMGHQVSGSDLRESLGVTRLRAMGAEINIGHDARNVADKLGGVDLVAHSTAIPHNNVEMTYARSQDLPVLRRAEMLSAICALKHTVAIGGTHGKTTTTSMLSLCLVAAALQPSFLVGGDLNEIGASAVWNRDGELFVVEADESDGTFLALQAPIVLITNIEADHLDFYGSAEALYEAFEEFASSTELAVMCIDDAQTRSLAQHLKEASPSRVVTYGCHSEADYRLLQVESDRNGVSFEIETLTASLGRFELPLPGMHNALNAAGAVAMSLELSADVEPVREALGRFGGVARRFERRGERNGVTFIDDYAHLPSEVAAVIAAARTGGWERVVAVFQPHRYSRTASLWQDFADVFTEADQIVLTGIYSAGEQPQPGITGYLIARAVLDNHPFAQVAYIPTWTDLRTYLETVLRPGDLCLTLGAGDLTTLPEELLAV